MSRAVALLATVLLLACSGGGTLPSPEILSVTPNQVTVPEGAPAEERQFVRISLDAVIAVHVDYGREEARTEAVRVWIGGQVARLTELAQDGTLEVEVPASLPGGTYDIRVALADGREAVRSSALTLVPVSPRSDDEPNPVDCPKGLDAGVSFPADAGTLPDAGGPEDPGPGGPIRPGDVTGFELEDVEDQQSGVPFPITIRAVGPRAAHFEEGVEVTINKKGTVSPTKVGPFVRGEYTALITVDAQGGNVKVTVTDAFGAQGTTNGFKIRK
ncbi:hypothetical protein HPC49_46460 [Pyxidicoccus fallax]|uniref:Lipoprotein n=1 Tax=Pyxidicoccus fallax TaxID=394095 RepID=A0A848LYU7_9BACT|nr:hypothetical protein [Pyxidicoccus fallax]NMO23016.1 hypothetical protein [Pyxidicoccus fallax]NPC85620.1 hypothetical protein [Pyxidicoccus fallax]